MFFHLIKISLKNIILYPYRSAKFFILILKMEINEYKNPFKKRYSSLIKNYKSCGFNKDRDFYINYLNNGLSK